MPLGKQYAGMWTLSQQMQALSSGTWTGIPAQYRLFGWGANDSSNQGDIGNNTEINSSSPVQIGSDTNWLLVASGGAFKLAIRTDGTLWGWGRGQSAYGALGLNSTHNITRSSPVQIGSLTNWSDVSAGGQVSGAIKTDGTLWTWGRATGGALGLNRTYPAQQHYISVSSPTQIGADTNWYKITVQADNMWAVKTDGTLWAWGSNGGGHGSNSTTARSSPTQVGALTDWSKLTARQGAKGTVKSNGTLWLWGGNGSGTVGDGTAISRSSPVQVGALTNWYEVSSGTYATGATKTDYSLWTWGNGDYGALGQNLNYGSSRSSPVQVGTGNNWYRISGNNRFFMSIKTDGTLWGWGYQSNYGNLGINSLPNKSSPVQVGTDTDWYSITDAEPRNVHGIRLTPGT
jgi:alpha-tubulin suppressor-like RCC1 family protein